MSLPSTVADLNTEGDCEETRQCRGKLGWGRGSALNYCVSSTQKVTVRKLGSVGKRWGGVGLYPQLLRTSTQKATVRKHGSVVERQCGVEALPSAVADLNAEGDCEKTRHYHKKWRGVGRGGV